MRAICPSCEKETDIETVRAEEVVEVRGEKVSVLSEHYKCLSCGDSFENTRGHDSLEAAYREYRRRHKLLQPEEIQIWRRRYGLTQRELSQLLGWGGVTLSRYENGALQTEAHEKMLRLVMEPNTFLRLIVESGEILSKDKKDRLIRELTAVEDESCSLERIIKDKFGRYAPDEYSGYNKLDVQKLLNAILFFCRGGQLKTKLNKLLFYSDFKHFKEYTVSLTGSRYVHLPLGPVPDKYEYYFAELQDGDLLEAEELLVGNYIGEKLTSRSEPDLTIFADSELKVLTEVKERFKGFSSTEIKDFSHKERAYVETGMRELISYKFSEHLQI